MATRKKNRPRSSKRSTTGKPGDLAARRARGAAVKGGTATPRYTAPPDPDNVLNTLTKSPKTYLG